MNSEKFSKIMVVLLIGTIPITIFLASLPIFSLSDQTIISTHIPGGSMIIPFVVIVVVLIIISSLLSQT